LPLTPTRAIEQARTALELHIAERNRLDVVRRYWKGRQRLPAVIPLASPREVRVMAAASRVNVLPIVVNSLVQSAFVDGFRATDDDSRDIEVWKVWQANRMDARQTAIHRAAAAYGTSYAVVLPGEPLPVIRGASPRSMIALYGEDPDWPMWALERSGHGLWRLYDEEAVYYLSRGNVGDRFEHIETREHGLDVTPVVRFLDEEDLDADDEVRDDATLGTDIDATFGRGQIGPLMPIQDQIDLTTFGLQIAQHYGAFKQRYIIGWAAENEQEAIKSAASTILTFDAEPDSMRLGEFAQTDLDGYIKSREASLRHAATLSQTPVHELIGELVNLSAEALAAAEAGKDRKVDERKTLWGESHEQALWLAGQAMRVDIPDDSQVIWRDTSARAFAATIDGLGKMAALLGIPQQELWERVPNATQQDVARWKAAAAQGNAFEDLARLLDRQAGGDPAANGALG
jgi:hypothetical protein